MARLLSFLASAAVIASLLFRAVTPAAACSCAQTTLEQRVASAQAIVVGSAANFSTDPPLDPSTPDALDHHGYVRFTAEEYLKGGGPSEFPAATGEIFTFGPGGQVVTGINTCSALSEGSVGKRYVLFLSGSLENRPNPGICDGSTLL